MSRSDHTSSEGGAAGMLALVFLGLGWVVSVVFGNDFEIHRVALSVPFLVVGALGGLVDTWRRRRTVWGPALAAGIAALLYLSVRAAVSPVWDLGRHDLLLASAAWLTVATVAACATTPRRLAVLCGLIVLVFAGHFAVGLYQYFGDAGYALFRGPRREGTAVSGLFWQKNTLAGMLALILPFFLGLALGSRRTVLRIVFATLLGAGIVLLVFTQSRAGFAAVVIGLGAVGGMLLVRRSRAWSWSGRLAAWSGVAVAVIGAALLVVMVAGKFSKDRRQGDLESAVGRSSRLVLAGLAFDQWMEKPLTGTGAQSFSYLAVKNWDPETLPKWMGNPDTVHNEYMEILSGYGLVGLLLVLAFALAVFGRPLFAHEEDEDEDAGPLGKGLRLGSFGGFLAVMAHAGADFQLHFLPIVILAGVAAGLLAQVVKKVGLGTRVVHSIAVVMAAVGALVATGAEIRSAGNWLRWESALMRADEGMDEAELALFGELVTTSPHYVPARTYGRIYYEAYMQDPGHDMVLLKEANRALSIAYERHPYDQETAGNHAIVLDLLGRHEEATPVFLRAVEMCWRRENKYGAVGAMALHLHLRGRKIWFEGSRTEDGPRKALGFILLARQYLEASRYGASKTGGAYRRRMRNLEKDINTLQSGRIKAQFPEGIPGPPTEGL